MVLGRNRIFGGKNADDPAILTVQTYGLTHHLGVGPEMVVPDVMAEDHDRMFLEAGLRFVEKPPQAEA